MVVALRLQRAPSQLLIPLAFAAHAGSQLALTGSPVNVLMSQAAKQAGVGSFSFFAFSLVGVPLLLGTIAIVLLLGERLLPHRTAKTLPPDLSAHAETLCRQYLRGSFVYRLSVTEESPSAERPLDVLMRAHPGVELVGVQAGGEGGLVFPDVLHVGDVMRSDSVCQRPSRKSGKLARNVISARSIVVGGIEITARMARKNADSTSWITSLARRARGSSTGPANRRTPFSVTVLAPGRRTRQNVAVPQ